MSKQLVTVVTSGDAFLKVDVSDTAVRQAARAGVPAWNTEGRRLFVRRILSGMGYVVREFESGNLDPIYVTGKRGIANAGFTAIAHIRTDVLA